LLTEAHGSLQVKALTGKPGERKYLISAQWWRQWSDFVNFDAPD
jgi:hypothetical protein